MHVCMYHRGVRALQHGAMYIHDRGVVDCAAQHTCTAVRYPHTPFLQGDGTKAAVLRDVIEICNSKLIVPGAGTSDVMA